LGAIHRIVRAQYGPLDAPTTAALGWRDDFFLALELTLDAARTHPLVAAQLSEVTQAIARLKSAWSDPPRFVFSHVDGLQGMVVKTTQGWQFSGVFDIEDYIYTDQRFVLAVFELIVALNRATLQPSFWAAYATEQSIDPTYSRLRPLFQLYVLLDWIKDRSPDEELAMQLNQQIDRLVHTG
jgi:hypothetical protein